LNTGPGHKSTVLRLPLAKWCVTERRAAIDDQRGVLSGIAMSTTENLDFTERPRNIEDLQHNIAAHEQIEGCARAMPVAYLIKLLLKLARCSGPNFRFV